MRESKNRAGKPWPCCHFVKVILHKLKHYVLYKYSRFLIFLDRGHAYDDVIIRDSLIKGQSHKTLVLFSHFDRQDTIDPYVLYYLEALNQAGTDIVFLSASEAMPPEEDQKLVALCRRVVIKKNIGYDFGAWRLGMALMEHELGDYDRLILCNDSIYAPLHSFGEMFRKMDAHDYDFWGITDNNDYENHIQSYFMVFSPTVFMQAFFYDFWRGIRSFRYKENIIVNYEVGLSKMLKAHGYKLGVFCPTPAGYLKNVTHYKWKELVNKKCPAIKVELLRDNPGHVDIGDWKEVIGGSCDYDVSLIVHHLERIKPLNEVI